VGSQGGPPIRTLSDDQTTRRAKTIQKNKSNWATISTPETCGGEWIQHREKGGRGGRRRRKKKRHEGEKGGGEGANKRGRARPHPKKNKKPESGGKGLERKKNCMG